LYNRVVGFFMSNSLHEKLIDKLYQFGWKWQYKIIIDVQDVSGSYWTFFLGWISPKEGSIIIQMRTSSRERTAGSCITLIGIKFWAVIALPWTVSKSWKFQVSRNLKTINASRLIDVEESVKSDASEAKKYIDNICSATDNSPLSEFKSKMIDYSSMLIVKHLSTLLKWGCIQLLGCDVFFKSAECLSRHFILYEKRVAALTTKWSTLFWKNVLVFLFLRDKYQLIDWGVVFILNVWGLIPIIRGQSCCFGRNTTLQFLFPQIQLLVHVPLDDFLKCSH
jgi:hypothetical protein